MNKIYFVTRRGRANLVRQRERLREELQAATREMGNSAKRDNDLRENPEYLHLQSRISYELPNKIGEIGKIIESSQLIENLENVRNGRFDEVTPGSEVVLAGPGNKVVRFSILGYGDGDLANGVISYLTPVASSLIGKTEGEDVILSLGGCPAKYEILSIARSPFIE